MSTESQLQVHRVQVAGPPLAPPAGEEEQTGAVTLLHRRLRGRYPLAISLASVFGAMGVVGGYLATVPQYTSEALVQISPTIPRVLYKTEENEMPPLFESFVSSQASLLQQSRVLSKAAEDPNLRAAGWPPLPEGISELKHSVSVSHKRGEQIITVQATTEDPIQAERAANAVIDAYEVLYGGQHGSEAAARENALVQHQRKLQDDIRGIHDSILRFGEMYGTDQMDEIYQARLDEFMALNSDISKVKQRIATLEATAVDNPQGSDGVDLSLENLATIDAELGKLVSEQEALDAELEQAERFGPRHMQTRKLREDRRVLETRIATRLEKVTSMMQKHPAATTSIAQSADEMNLNQTKALLANLEKTRDEVQKELQDVGSKQMSIDEKKREEQLLSASLADTSRALEAIRVEKENAQQGRINIIKGDRPTQPSKDRRFQLAVLGGMAGAGFGVGLVFLFGMLRPSYRYLDEIEEAEALVPVLGTLPDLNTKDADLESLASLSVHHLRNMLAMQARPRAQGGTAFMITSARPGDGKTSLTVALGMSFAAQGTRVLLIDADLIGHGLSPSMHVDGKPGLRQAGGNGGIDSLIYPSRIANLSVLPAGQSSRNGTTNGKPAVPADGSLEAEHLSVDRMRHVIDEARSRFDIVLVDTGPLMGSLEANVVATVVDRVVMTVPRGQDPRLLRAALGRLRSVGGVCAGLVFNRATASDLRSSMSTISFHSQSMRAAGDLGSGAGAESRHALVRAILMSGSAESKGDKHTDT